MSKKTVFVEKSQIATESFLNSTLVGAYHYAVKVDGQWYEGINACHIGAFIGTTGMIITSDAERTARGGAWLSLAGATFKTFDAIREYCKKWWEDHPDYSCLETNCQKFAFDLAQWLVPSLKLEQLLAQTNVCAEGPGSHSISAEG